MSVAELVAGEAELDPTTTTRPFSPAELAAGLPTQFPTMVLPAGADSVASSRLMAYSQL